MEHSHDHDHSHTHEHDHAYLHEHGIAHSHGHVHENQKAVINRLARALGHLKDHMRHCMVDAVTAGDHGAIDDLCQAIDKFMK